MKNPRCHSGQMNKGERQHTVRRTTHIEGKTTHSGQGNTCGGARQHSGQDDTHGGKTTLVGKTTQIVGKTTHIVGKTTHVGARQHTAWLRGLCVLMTLKYTGAVIHIISVNCRYVLASHCFIL